MLTTFLAISIVGLLVLVLFLWDELRHRDAHLRWVDERDKGMVFLFEKVDQARVVPRANFLDGFKEYGMLTANAKRSAWMLLREADERLTYYLGFLNRAVGAAKEVAAWEGNHPPPPVSRWKSRAAAVGAESDEPDGPTMIVVETGQDVMAAGPQPKPLGAGAFGPELGDDT